MFGLGASTLIIILIIILLIFGISQLPKLAKTLNASAKEVRKDMNEVEGETKPSPKKTAKKR
jgi:TatA/E family protein of Tat protein translocase